MLQTAVVAVRDRARLQEIVAVLLRFGLDDLVGELGLKRHTPADSGGTEAGIATATRPERVRRALEQLGPTFVKIGQLLATRADLLGPEWTQELEKLHSHVTPVPWSEIGPQIEADLGAPIAQVFMAFEETPLASASIAQVYRAVLADGTPGGRAVVVKAQRPGLSARIEADLRLLTHLAGLLEDQWPALARYQPRVVARQLATAVRDEMDFTKEAQSCEAIAAHFAGQDDIVLPRIAWECTSTRLLVQDYLDGVEGAAVATTPGLDGAVLARRGARAFLQMALRDGLFHADPHPGNLLALAGNRVGFIDFGLVGRLSERRRGQLVVLLRAIVEGSAQGVTMVLLAWSSGAAHDLGRLEATVENFVARHGSQPLSLAQALQDFMGIARETSILLPPDLALLFKSFVTAEGMLRQLDATFDVVEVAAPIVREQLGARYSLRRLRRQREAVLADLYDLADEAPQTLRLLMYRLRQGRIGADIEIHHIGWLAGALERSATRLAIAVVTAAAILGLAPHLMAMSPVWFGVPVFPALGIVAVCVGIVLLLLSFRRRRAPD
ncbi:AarF/UbiB family protein [Ramlibacter sp. H39-3-26]|uniref:ABC1 kinase family protein n=1 Tax=Curvibacter soli TaxID=3031331 RepID=UPI0023DC071C|nr:AarF/UbiB family protein [Ramlibacter sp. H39-3-26]MDF1485002.1 AarF/UbiB family protein [Ramlibacter sp. H39-3-26]